MKIQIRQGVFETNSSSMHSLTMCTDKEFEAWENGELLWCRYGENDFVENTKENIQDEDTYPYERYREEIASEYDTFKTEKNNMVAFGYYGYEG